ncbi:AAA family ATPase [Bradyrhizobium manausense]|uniref:AAA family ATPase n=1 Tax=Bradyrhizobium manausense TaxID=989370 RepID=UPI001BA53FAC|nr:AAA family ATPase [Bradyrhizobium manausense]MBR0832314.1 AAA family ATPase [Bradyrhizobium manausense]
MIIEFFGPPGAGKTTLARTLAARLREHNYTVDLVLSHRPAERSPSESAKPSTALRKIAFAVRRLTRPPTELASMLVRPRGLSRDLRTALNLIKVLPPSNALSSLRLLQYMSRLSHAWYRKSAIARIVLFDQAFVQAICSLTLLCGIADEALISYALDLVPEPDLLIRLDAPAKLLEERLRDRHDLGSKVERLLELDLETSLNSRNVVDLLHDLLCRKGRNVVSISSVNQPSLAAAVEQMERQIVSMVEQRKRAATKPAHVGADISGHSSLISTIFDPDLGALDRTGTARTRQ